MTHNIGTADRALRIFVGVALLALTWVGPIAVLHGAVVQIIATVVGLVLIGTALVRSCPLYTLLGVKTCA